VSAACVATKFDTRHLLNARQNFLPREQILLLKLNKQVSSEDEGSQGAKCLGQRGTPENKTKTVAGTDGTGVGK
jgi:hypothetical protein